jgi:hypothetical protein
MSETQNPAADSPPSSGEGRAPESCAKCSKPLGATVTHCSRCCHDNSLGNKNCEACGCFLPRNKAAYKHGLVEYDRHEILPEEVAAHEHAFKADVLADLGGADNLTAIERGYVINLVRTNTVIELIAAYLRDKGALTDRGRQRTSVATFFQAVQAYDRLAQRLGLQRRTKPYTRTIEDVVAEDDQPQPEDGHAEA